VSSGSIGFVLLIPVGRLLHISFTLRGNDKLIRVISAPFGAKRRSGGSGRSMIPALCRLGQGGAGSFPNLKPSTTAISLRLPVTLLERIKVAANKRDVPYQSLIKAWLAEKTGTR